MNVVEQAARIVDDTMEAHRRADLFDSRFAQVAVKPIELKRFLDHITQLIQLDRATSIQSTTESEDAELANRLRRRAIRSSRFAKKEKQVGFRVSGEEILACENLITGSAGRFGIQRFTQDAASISFLEEVGKNYIESPYKELPTRLGVVRRVGRFFTRKEEW